MSVVVIRPYTRRIRERVFALLSAAGLDMESATIIAPGTPDDDVIAQLQARRVRALLIPFHAHRDRNGDLVNGLELARRISGECTGLDGTPIFMPISSMGMSSATLMLSRDADADGLPQLLQQRILFMPENELGSRKIESDVSSHAARQFATA